MNTELMTKLKKTIICLLLFMPCVHSYAQHSTSSPYSILGLGELDSRSYGLNSGMANAGIGLYLPGQLNVSNPATLAIDSLAFVFDVSIAGKLSQFSSMGVKEYTNNFNLKKVAFGVRVFPKLSMSMGFRPYSNVQYTIQSEKYIEGGNGEKYNVYYEGSGGLSDLYLTSSYKLFPNLYIGANMSYLFGRINRAETVMTQTVQTTSEVDKIIFDFGLMYDKVLSTANRISAGLTYGYKSEIKLKNYKTYTMTGDTKTKTSSYTSVPHYVGAGFSIQNVKGYSFKIFSIDYKFSNWDKIKSPEKSMSYQNSHRVNAGVMYVPNYRTPKKYFQRMQYQLGGYYEKSNLKIKGNNLSEKGVTVGAIFPIKNSLSQIAFSMDFGQRGGKGLINENFVMFNLAVSINQKWFEKWFYN